MPFAPVLATEHSHGLPIGIGVMISNKAEELGGTAKEAAGDATDNRSLEAEGKTDQTGAQASR